MGSERRARGGSCWVLFLLVSACSSEPLDSEPLEPDTVPRSEFGAVFADVYCDVFEGCCEDEGYAFDPERCRSAVGDPLSETALEELSVSYDPEAGTRCLESWAQQIVECRPRLDQEVASACEAALVGELEAGEPCQDSVECAPAGAFRSVCQNDQANTARCQPDLEPERFEHGEEGDPCTGSCREGPVGPSCSGVVLNEDDPLVSCYESDGLFCGLGDTCQPLLHEGDSCLLEGCVPELFCDLDTLTCLPRRESGPCFTFDDCGGDTYCAESLTCEPKLEDGAACIIPDQCASGGCKDEGVCGPASIASSDSCSF